MEAAYGLLAGLLPCPSRAGKRAPEKSHLSLLEEPRQHGQGARRTFSQENCPCLVAGDFNTPHHGYNHGILFDHLIDSHEARGDGFGFTFPGTTHNPLAMYGPWLRIDYGIGYKNWRALYAKTEPYRESQHRAHVGRFELKKK